MNWFEVPDVHFFCNDVFFAEDTNAVEVPAGAGTPGDTTPVPVLIRGLGLDLALALTPVPGHAPDHSPAHPGHQTVLIYFLFCSFDVIN